MCAPGGITKVEQRAVEEACLSAGARQVALIEEPMAAAIGAGMPVDEAKGSMVVDIGGGTSEVAVISLGGMVVSRSVRVGGYEFDDAIMSYIRRAHNIAIGQPTAEELKFQLGSATALEEELEAEVRGRDLVSGLPKTLRLSSQELRQPLEEPLSHIVIAVKETLEETPPELAADISERGILLAGGGSLLRGFDARLHEETGMDVYLAESPLTCVAVGAGHALEEFETLREAGRVGKRRRVRGPAARPSGRDGLEARADLIGLDAQRGQRPQRAAVAPGAARRTARARVRALARPRRRLLQRRAGGHGEGRAARLGVQRRDRAPHGSRR